MLDKELQMKNNEISRYLKLEEDKRLLSGEIEWLKRELNSKSSDLNNERTKLDELIRVEQVFVF